MLVLSSPLSLYIILPSLSSLDQTLLKLYFSLASFSFATCCTVKLSVMDTFLLVIFYLYKFFSGHCTVPTCIVLLNCIVHLNTVNRIVCNSTIASFKIWHSPDFRFSGCGKRTIWFYPDCPFKKKIKSKSGSNCVVLLKTFNNFISRYYTF